MQVRGGGRKTIGSDLSLNDLSPEAEVLSHRIRIARKLARSSLILCKIGLIER
jgi:hypothetical protein